jgi:exonuclease SbcC
LWVQDLQCKHGSADAISLTIKDLESALKEAGAIPSLRLEVGKLEERARTIAAETDVAGKSKVEAEHTLEEADKLYENLHARDRGAALRHELKPGEPCPVCEQVVRQLPPVPDSEDLANAGRRVAEAKAAIKQWQSRLSALVTEAQSIPGKIALALEKASRLQQRVDEMVARVRLPVGHSPEEAIPGLRALVIEIKAAELGAQQANYNYETALQAQGKAVGGQKAAEHEMAILEAQAATIGDRIEQIKQELTTLDGILSSAPDLGEIRTRTKALDDARTKRVELEGLKSNREAALRGLQNSVSNLGQTLASLESQRAAAETSIRGLERDVAKSERQLKKALAETALDDSPDEAAQIQRLEKSNRTALESAQQEVTKCRLEIGDLEKRISRNEKLAQEIAQLKAEGALYRDLGTWLNAGNFQQYVLGSAFEILAKEGSKHLRQLSAGRYEFVFEDDEFMVSDHSNADETRSVKTLSGGDPCAEASFITLYQTTTATAASLRVPIIHRCGRGGPDTVLSIMFSGRKRSAPGYSHARLRACPPWRDE